MYRLCIWLAAVTLLPQVVSQAQTVSQNVIFATGVDESQWRNISMSSTEIMFTDEDDGTSPIINIGFNFTMGDVTASQFTMNTNGVIRMGSTPVSGGLNNIFNDSHTQYPFISAYATDTRIDFGTTESYAKYELQGTAPSRVMVIEVVTPPDYSQLYNTLSYQVQLHENNNSIVIVYGYNAGVCDLYMCGIGFNVNDRLAIRTTSHTDTAIGSYYTQYNSTLPTPGRYYALQLPAASCATPTLESIATATDSASIEWSGSADSYILEYGAGTQTTDTIIYGITATRYTLRNLLPATRYHFTLRGVCDGDTSGYLQGDFATHCLPGHLPYAYGWESSDTLATCWEYWNESEIDPTYQDAHSGNKALLFPLNNGRISCATLPMMEAELGGTSLSFYAKKRQAMSYNTGVLQVGYYTTEAGERNFVSLYSISPNHSDWELYTVAFPDSIDYPADARAGWWGQGGSTAYSTQYMIDDVHWFVTPDCPFASNLAVTASANHALFTWDYERASGEFAPTGYTLSYAALDDIDNRTDHDVYNRSVTIGPLEPHTRYRAWVYPYCDGDHYGGSDSITFTTNELPCVAYAHNDTIEISSGYTASTEALLTTAAHYSYRQMIYNAEDVGDSAFTIRKIAWQRSDNYSSDVTTLNNVDVYLAHVPDSINTLQNCFVPFDTNTFKLVKRGLNFGGTGWIEFELDSAFVYNGRSKLVVAINAHIPVYDFSASFYYASGIGNSRAINSDVAAFDPRTLAADTGVVSVYRPNIRFYNTECQTPGRCATPAVMLDSLSNNFARIMWAPGTDESYWNVYYKQSSSNVWIPFATNTPYQEAELTGLQVGKGYDIKVMGICADSLYTILSFTTHCGTVAGSSLPYFEDFATTNDRDIPACWAAYDGDDASNYPFVQSDDNQDKYLQLYSSSDYNYYNLAVLPEMEVALDSLEMTLELYTPAPIMGWFGAMPYSGTLIVGAMSDPYDLATFEPIDTLTQVVTETWQEFLIDLGSYTGNGHYIAFYQDIAIQEAQGLYSDEIHVTNVNVSYQNNCRQLTGAYATNLTYQSADIVLQDADNAGPNRYVVYYGTVDERDYATDSMLFTGLTGTLTGLTASTTYYGWASVLCDSTGVSRPRAFRFTTPAACWEVENLTAQYSVGNHSAILSWNAPSAGFAATRYIVSYTSSNNSAWTVDTVTDNYYFIQGLLPDSIYRYQVTSICNSYVSFANSGSFSTFSSCNGVETGDHQQTDVPFDANYNYGYSQSIYLAAELSYMSDTLHGIYLHNGNAIANNTSLIDVYVGNSTRCQFANSSDWEGDSNLTQVASNYSLSVNAAGWVYIPFSTPFVRNSNENIIVAIDNNTGSYTGRSYCPQWISTLTASARSIYNNNDYTNYTPAAPPVGNYYTNTGNFVPDMRFDAPCLGMDCAAPMLISTAQTTNSITLRWYAGGTETAWDVEYRLLGDTVWTSFLTNSSNTTGTLNGLLNGSTYEVRLSCTCGGNSYNTVQQFSTLCSPLSLPFTENFNVLPTGAFARNCWETGSAQNSLPTVELFNNEKMLTMADGAYLVAPDFTATVNTMQVHLDYMGTDAGDFIYVGVLANSASLQSFVAVDTLVVRHPYTMESATVHFNGYNSTEGNICFYMPAGYPLGETFRIDNLIFDLHSDCPEVDSVWTLANTATSATVAWSIVGGTASGYLVEYGPAGYTRGTGITVSSGTTSVTLNGLQNSTMYDLYVTPICYTGDTMYASSLLRFATECGIVDLPYSMNFDLPYIGYADNTGAMPTCWHYAASADEQNSEPQIVTNSNYQVSGTQALYLYQTAVVALPDFGVAVDTLQLSFYARSGFANAGYSLVVGVVDSTTPGFEASFVGIDTIDCDGGIYDTVLFCGTTASGHIVAFKNIATEPNWNGIFYADIYLDDVVVDYRPSCLPVQHITRDSSNINSISLHWSSCGSVASYEIEYGAPGFAIGQGDERITTTTNAVTLTGLATASQYDIYVRSLCGGGDASPWSMITLATQACNSPVETFFYYDTASTATSSVIPGSAYYNYSYSQIIIDSAMMADNGFSEGSSVTGFSFYPTGTTSSTYFDRCSILMRNDTAVAFGESGFVTMEPGDVTYTGTLNWMGAGWRDVIFLAPFVWDGHSSVILAIDRDHGVYSNEGDASFRATTVSTNRAITVYVDDENIDPFNPGYLNSYAVPTHIVPQIKLLGCLGPACETTLDSLHYTYNEATLTWSSPAETFEVNIKAANESEWPADRLVNNVASYTFTGLSASTTYQYRLRSLCADGSISQWEEGRFTTDTMPCYVPSDLTATATFATAEMNWSDSGFETEWYLHVWTTAYDHTLRVATNPATVSGLVPGMTYNAAVRAICGDTTLLSNWSDTISFTTEVCDPVTNVTVDEITASHAVVSWTAGENNNGNFVVEYGVEGFAAGHGIATLTTTESHITLEGLEGETNYEVVVRAVCDGQYNSGWSTKVAFSTPVGINSADGKSVVTLYPNPADASTTLRVEGAEGEVTVTLADMNGRIVQHHTLSCTYDCSHTLPLTHLPAGIYYARIQGNNLNTLLKLIVR